MKCRKHPKKYKENIEIQNECKIDSIVAEMSFYAASMFTASTATGCLFL